LQDAEYFKYTRINAGGYSTAAETSSFLWPKHSVKCRCQKVYVP